MSKIYLRGGDSRTTALTRVHCVDEKEELHRLLLNNHDLLPGEQIDPEAPRRWLLIKHEMPVRDPATGTSRWSIDLFFADQFAIPTLVECKRCDDTRTRREVIAQMLEYAANGHHYWTADEMCSYAQKSAGGADKLDAALREIGRMDESAKDFFASVQQNLREAKMRPVFFLEESPNELRSLVDFMNKQLKDTEVLIVEARQYQQGNDRIVVPWLFGFTEEARVAKRESRADTIRAAGERGEDAFWRSVESGGLSESTRNKMREFIADWSNGRLSAYGHVFFGVNAIFVLQHIVKSRGLFALNRSESLEMYFGYWDEAKYADIGPREIGLRDDFIGIVQTVLGLTFSEQQRRAFPKIAPDKWVSKADQLWEAVRSIFAKHFGAS
jgi:hypothetical protein